MHNHEDLFEDGENEARGSVPNWRRSVLVERNGAVVMPLQRHVPIWRSVDQRHFFRLATNRDNSLEEELL